MEALGLDVKLLVAQLINFGILFFVLSKLLYTPLLKILDERKKKIDDSIKNNQEIEERLVKIEEKQKELLGAARKKANEEAQVIINMAHEEKETIIAGAKSIAEREAQKAIGRLETLENETAQRLEKKLTDQLVQKVIAKVYPKSGSKKILLNNLLGK